MTETLTVELATEELPPKALKRLSESFAQSLASGLAARDLLSPSSVVVDYATPRRLATTVSHVRERSPDQSVKQKILPVNVAQDESGRPTAALIKKLASLKLSHLTLASLLRETDGKNDVFFYRTIVTGQSLQAGLQESLDAALSQLPIPKVMRYQRPDGSTVSFVRPAHRLLALYGAEVVPVRALGLDAGRATPGHRFLSRGDLSIATAAAYEPTLAAEGKVIASFNERRARIVAGLDMAAAGLKPIAPDLLVDEVTGLVEWPAVYGGSFDASFLKVPHECLILSMQQHQKYFALADPAGRLTNRFLLVSNLETRDPSAIVNGNERVLRARLADAKFFFDQDKKEKLALRVPRLAHIVYQRVLGSALDRTKRVMHLAGNIARALKADAVEAERAALLAKADLLTEMVGEFPELQGIMGRYYALHDGESPAVADAIEQHYWPRFAGDAVPTGAVAVAVALADKLETLVGLFGIGEAPSGDKDPFGLRRSALGLLRILMDNELPLPLDKLLTWAFDTFAGMSAVGDVRGEVASFVFERLRGLLRDRGYTAHEVDAVISLRPARIDLVLKHLDAVRAFGRLPEAESLAAANKRIGNIVRKADGVRKELDANALREPAEQALFAAFTALKPRFESLLADGEFTAALTALSALKVPVDAFFDDVMVMVEEPRLRENRLALLSEVRRLMNRLADISKLST